MTFTLSFTKRGFEVAHKLVSRRAEDEPEVPQIPPLAALIFVLTLVAFFVVLFAISYTYGHLITTLCMVESASSTAYVPITTVEPTDDAPPAYSEDGTPKPVDEEDNLVHTKPITASLRDTVQHLKAKAGFWSRFRGLQVYVVWNFARSLLVGIFSATSHNPFVVIGASILAEIALVSFSSFCSTTKELCQLVTNAAISGKSSHDMDSRYYQ